jgi:hypothetical protein
MSVGQMSVGQLFFDRKTLNSTFSLLRLKLEDKY